jgi:hypothetical protein
MTNPFIKSQFGGNLTYRMTPAMAQFLLSHYYGNIRDESVGGVSKLATSMRENRFYLTGDCIKFEKDTGKILDGHHRLEAVVLSNQEVLLSVAWGVEREALLAIDTGIPRNAGICIASALNESKENNTLWRKRASVANMCLRAQNNFRLRDMPDAAAKLAYYQTHQSSIDTVTKAGVNRKTNGSGFRGAMALYFQADPIKAQKLYNLVTGDGSELPSKSPAHTLYRYFERDSRGQGGESNRMKKDFYATSRAIEAHANNQQLLPQSLNMFA